MDIFCKACGKEAQTDVEYKWGCGNTTCCFQSCLIPITGLILACQFNLCLKVYHDVIHRCRHCKAEFGRIDYGFCDVCVCGCNKKHNAKTVDQEPLTVYRGRGVDAFVSAQEWPGSLTKNGCHRGYI